MGLVNWGLLSLSIFSNSLHLFVVSVFSVSCIFDFGVSFCLSLSAFLYGEESVEAGCRIGDLLSFDLILVGDFITGCFISCVVGVIAIFSSVSVFSNRVCVWADDSSLFSARSTDVVGVSAALVVSSEALILLMKLSQSPGSNWIKVLTIISYLLHGDLLC